VVDAPTRRGRQVRRNAVAEGKRPIATPDELRPLAHLVQQGEVWRFHTLHDHLRQTGEAAAQFGLSFGSADWARLAGLWHDLGKYRPVFQAYLGAVTGYDDTDGAPQRVDHSTAGAIHAIQQLGLPGRVIAYAIAGHHAGLADWQPGDRAGRGLSQRLEQRELLDEVLAVGEVASLPVTARPTTTPPTRGSSSEIEGMHLWVRMLFSCLVDADFLDTERFFDSTRSDQRTGWATLDSLRALLTAYQDALPTRRPIDVIRTQVKNEVVAKAQAEPGFFSLTVPTGGGKTLTSLRFALEHALIHGHRRVIYAIPYLSIIEQTAEVFRSILGDQFLEHHSSLDPDEGNLRQRAAAETWDAPLIVTTTVQLFESLFAARGSRCRRLHNIAGSVIVLDEAQLLPPDFLDPILSVLRSLVAGYGVSVVLCTATQPALARRSSFGSTFRGLDGVRELVGDPDALFDTLDRVGVEWPADMARASDWQSIADRLADERQVLCVVNSRADCRALVAAMPREADAVHLSALMCAEHRSAVIARTKARLAAGDPVRLVSTQLIEAGVDIDFPVVFRALAGLDSIAQSGGRCNREGSLERGKLVVFVPPKPAPIGHLRRGEQATRSIVAVTSQAERLRPDAFRRFFERFYAEASLDRRVIRPLLVDGARRLEFAFRTASERFQMVADEGTATILVPYGRGAGLLAALQRSLDSANGPDRRLLRSLQRFTVSVHRGHLLALQRVAALTEVQPDVYALDQPDRYDERLGLLVDDPPGAIPDLVV
jgi:CRISPR-associated endonuclease/helicase Cas3